MTKPSDYWTGWTKEKTLECIKNNYQKFKTFDELYEGLSSLEFGGMLYRIIKSERLGGESAVEQEVREFFNSLLE